MNDNIQMMLSEYINSLPNKEYKKDLLILDFNRFYRSFKYLKDRIKDSTTFDCEDNDMIYIDIFNSILKIIFLSAAENKPNYKLAENKYIDIIFYSLLDQGITGDIYDIEDLKHVLNNLQKRITKDMYESISYYIDPKLSFEQVGATDKFYTIKDFSLDVNDVNFILVGYVIIYVKK